MPDPNRHKKRSIERLVGGAVVVWDCKKVLTEIEKAISRVNKRAAFRVERLAKSIVMREAYDTGALHRSIQAKRSEYQESSERYNWLITAGGGEVDYAMHVETGRYFKSTNKRIEPVPFLRRATTEVKRDIYWLMRRELRRAIKKAGVQDDETDILRNIYTF